MRAHGVRLATLAALAAVALVLSACGDKDGGNVDTDQVDAVEAPQLGACRVLTPEDVALPSNATKVVDCSKEHTAETFARGRPAAGARRRRVRRAGAGRVRLPDLLGAVPGVPRRRREHGDAHRRELGVVPAVGEGVGQGRAVVPLRRRSAAASRARSTSPCRPRPPGCSRSSPPTTSGWSASTGRRCRARRRSRAARSTTGARSPRSRSATPRTPTPATGWSR